MALRDGSVVVVRLDGVEEPVFNTTPRAKDRFDAVYDFFCDSEFIFCGQHIALTIGNSRRQSEQVLDASRKNT